MSNIISEKFLNYPDRTADEVNRLVEKAVKRASFVVTGETWRGRVYTSAKVGTVILSGMWRDRKAILKIQLLPLEHEEAELIKAFTLQNSSRLIRAPEIYVHQAFNLKEQFGFMVMEAIEAEPIYEPPFADLKKREAYADFLAEFYANAVRRPFLQAREQFEQSTEAFLLKRLDSWIVGNRMAAKERRLEAKLQERLILQYEELCRIYGSQIPMTFTHGHLGPNDVRVEGKKFVLLANAFWSYRPLYYNLGFNVWCELMTLYKLQSFTYEDVKTIVEEWETAYQRIPAVAEDEDFDWRYRLMILERCLGSVLMDLVVAERSAEAEARRVEQLAVMARLADHLIHLLS